MWGQQSVEAFALNGLLRDSIIISHYLSNPISFTSKILTTHSYQYLTLPHFSPSCIITITIDETTCTQKLLTPTSLHFYYKVAQVGLGILGITSSIFSGHETMWLWYVLKEPLQSISFLKFHQYFKQHSAPLLSIGTTSLPSSGRKSRTLPVITVKKSNGIFWWH
jgi:hypothetical protein